MVEEYRKAIALDFDGVLHSYTSGWQGIGVVADDPVPGSIGWLVGICLYSPYDVIITSCRCNEPAGIRAMEDWIYDEVRKYIEDTAYVGMEDPDQEKADDHEQVCATVKYAVQKPPTAFIFIDDRGWNFSGTFPSLTELDNFKPWNK